MVLAAWGGNIVFLRQTRARRLSCKSNHRCELTANFSNPFLAKPYRTFEFNNFDQIKPNLWIQKFQPNQTTTVACWPLLPSFETFAQVQRKTLPLLSQKRRLRGSLSLKGTVFWWPSDVQGGGYIYYHKVGNTYNLILWNWGFSHNQPSSYILTSSFLLGTLSKIS